VFSPISTTDALTEGVQNTLIKLCTEISAAVYYNYISTNAASFSTEQSKCAHLRHELPKNSLFCVGKTCSGGVLFIDRPQVQEITTTRDIPAMKNAQTLVLLLLRMWRASHKSIRLANIG
jgi:hypothetical protein